MLLKLKTRWNNVRTEFNVLQLTWMILLAIVISCMFSTPINKIVNFLLPEKPVTIVYNADNGNGIVQFIDTDASDVFEKMVENANDADWEFTQGIRGESWTTLIPKSDVAEITLKMKASPNACIDYFTFSRGGVFTLKTNESVIDIDTGITENFAVAHAYPFENNWGIVILRLFFYFVATVFVFVFLIGIRYRLLLGVEHKQGWLFSDTKSSLFFVYWIILICIAVLHYKVIGIENYLAYGDQYWYWYQAPAPTGLFDWSLMADRLYSFRGYWCLVIPSFVKYFGSLINKNPVYFYFIITTFCWSLLLTVIFPTLKKTLTGQNATYLEVFVFSLVSLYIWFGYLTAVLADLFGITAVMIGILCLLRFIDQRHIYDALISGIGFSISISYRAPYMYLTSVFAFYAIIVIVKDWKQIDKEIRKRSLVGFSVGMLAFLLICLPQFLINKQWGHFGLFPFSDDYAQNSGIDSLVRGAVLHRWTDPQMISMVGRDYPSDFLSGTNIQLMDLYTQNPIETIMVILKRLMMLFNQFTNVCYPDSIDWRGSSGIIFSCVNYGSLVLGLFGLLYSRSVTKREKVITLVAFVGGVLPFTYTYVEPRYSMFFYFVLYYFLSYHFVEDIVLNKLEFSRLSKNGRLSRWLSITCIMLLTFNFIFWTK